MFLKVSVSLDYPIVALEYFFAVNDDNVCAGSIKADKDILKFVQSSKTIMEADSNDENKTNKAFPVPTSSEMRNAMKSMRSY
ncbi:hypothetical protein TNCV_1029541 [Trichonephila clavipes]|nr:hypothetical protein TNCV_1029541 [Trichonephila clavipes]